MHTRLLAVSAAAMLAVGAASPTLLVAQVTKIPQFVADPWWPKPLPQEKDSQGQMRRWMTGHVAGVCADSHNHIFTFNRLSPKLGTYESMSGMFGPEIIVYDFEGNVVNSWGNPKGQPKVLPATAHGCTVDYEDNVWFTGASIAQKWDHDGKKILLQIGEVGKCDGECGETKSLNSSKTLLNAPAGLRVDPDPDPVTGQRGSIYIADGYGNHRVVVFDAKGHYLRQFGVAGTGPGEFAQTGGGHPHCVAISKDGFVYACDRMQNRIHEFDKLGNFKRTIEINPEGGMVAGQRSADIMFSNDPTQTYLLMSDLGNNVMRIIERKTGKLVGTIGVGPGRGTGQLITPHLIVTDTKGNLYISSTADSNRVQRFLLQP